MDKQKFLELLIAVGSGNVVTSEFATCTVVFDDMPVILGDAHSGWIMHHQLLTTRTPNQPLLRVTLEAGLTSNRHGEVSLTVDAIESLIEHKDHFELRYKDYFGHEWSSDVRFRTEGDLPIAEVLQLCGMTASSSAETTITWDDFVTKYVPMIDKYYVICDCRRVMSHVRADELCDREMCEKFVLDSEGDDLILYGETMEGSVFADDMRIVKSLNETIRVQGNKMFIVERDITDDANIITTTLEWYESVPLALAKM